MARLSLILFVLLCSMASRGQTVFTLTVNGLAGPSQVSFKKQDTTLKTGSCLNLDTTNKWSIHIVPATGFNLKIENASFGGDPFPVLLITKDTTLIISGDTVQKTNFVFGTVFNIVIQKLDAANTAVAAFKKLSLRKAPLSTAKIPPPPPPPPSAYKTSNALYDAFFLHGNGSPDDKKKVLAVYCGIPGTASNVMAKLDSALKDNLFLADYWKKLKDSFPPGAQTNIPLLSSLGSAVGGLNVTSIADGIAQFLIKRAKQELAMAYFDKFQALLSDSTRFKDLYTLFPQSYQNLKVVGTEIYNYQTYIQTLRSGFQKDLGNLPDNLPGIIDNHAVYFSKPNHAYLAAALRSGCYITANLKEGTHPGDILQGFPTNCLDPLKPAWKGSVQTLQLLSASLKDTAGSKDSTWWVNGTHVKQLVNDSVSFKLYIGLILQQARTFDKDSNNKALPVRFTASTTLSGILDSMATSYGPLRNFLTQLIAKANTLDALIKKNTKATTDSLKIEQYSAYFKAFVDLLQQGTQITTVPAFSHLIQAPAEANMSTWFDLARTTADLTLEVNRKEYSSAIVSVVHIYDVIEVNKDTVYATHSATVKLSSGKTAKKVKAATTTGIASINRQLDSLTRQTNATGTAPDSATLARVAKNISSVRDSLTTLTQASKTVTDTILPGNTRDYLFKYGSFMAAMVLSKSSSDVENTIEAFALPAGSSRIKRETVFNVALNGYAGLYYGHEQIPGIKDHLAFNSYGVTAPVGIALSWGHRLFFINTGDNGWKTGKKGWSTSIFFSLIDVGAIAAYRVGNDSVQQVPTIQLKDIFSPGAFLSLGIPKSPLSVNFGVQLGPNLRTVDNAKNDYEGKTYLRYSASLCVDIPIVNFYTKSKE